MLEINIRIFFPKKGNSLFPDYHEHLKLLEPLDGQIRNLSGRGRGCADLSVLYDFAAGMGRKQIFKKNAAGEERYVHT